MLGVGGLLEDGGSSPVDSVLVDALQIGQWTPGDLLSSLYCSLQAFDIIEGLSHNKVIQLVKMLSSTIQLQRLLRISGDMPNFLRLLRKNSHCWAIFTSFVMLSEQVRSSLMWMPRYLKLLTFSTSNSRMYSGQ